MRCSWESRGLAPWRELQGSNTPLPKKILHFALCIIAGPFQFEITKTYDLISGGCKGGAVLLIIRDIVFRRTINGPLFCQDLHNLWCCRELSLENVVFGELNMYNFRSLLVYIYKVFIFWWGLKDTQAPLPLQILRELSTQAPPLTSEACDGYSSFLFFFFLFLLSFSFLPLFSFSSFLSLSSLPFVFFFNFLIFFLQILWGVLNYTKTNQLIISYDIQIFEGWETAYFLFITATKWMKWNKSFM